MKWLMLFFVSIGMVKGFSFNQNMALLTVPGYSKQSQIEIFMQTPDYQEAPLLIFVYEDISDLGLEDSFRRWSNYWVAKGYKVAGISLPGCSATSVTKDFYGSCTMTAIHSAVDHIKQISEVRDFGVIGFGLGSLAGSLLAVEREDVRCIVCIDGGYDFMRHLYPGDPLYEVIRQGKYDLDFEDSEGLRRRSLLYQVDRIGTPFYLVHQIHHAIIPAEEASDFAVAMWHTGTECLLSVFESSKDREDFYTHTFATTERWVDRHMDLSMLRSHIYQEDNLEEFHEKE